MLLENRVALVTGAARGIGRAIALVMAAEGAHVGVVDILPEAEDTAEAVAGTGRRSAAVRVDISDPVQVLEGVDQIRRELGDIEILVNNAGIVANISALEKMSPESWEKEISVNLSGAFRMIQAVIGPMLEKRWGRIVNISSMAATGGLHRQIGYAASKAGLLGLTKTVTLEHARDGITCNAVLPGMIGTELVNAMPPEILQAAVGITPARRIGDIEEVGHLVAFLASDRAAFINGAVIPVDGGISLNAASLGSRKEVRGQGVGSRK